MDVTFDVDLEKFRYSLVGDGYLKEEVIKMTQDDLINVLQRRVYQYINAEYDKSKRYGLLD